MKKLTACEISPSFSKELQADSEVNSFTRHVQHAHYSLANTVVPSKPEWVHLSTSFLEDYKLEVGDEGKLLRIVSGAEKFNGFESYAMCYGGHQFGHWAGQLGDGRAINIAELNVNGKNLTFQLKGAGPTPYSRRADGFAVLRSSIREYLCSEAMHHLGVPTTRALSLVKTGDWVTRDKLYNGNPKNELGAIVCRVSESFIRFGSFEIFASRGEKKELKQLVDYTIKYHFSELGEPSKSAYLLFFKEVVNRTKDLMIHWQRVGFVHGVMNTDNLSILGQTIDYGPFGWLENYDPHWTPNTTDLQHKRYRFGKQPNMALWNLTQLANALYPLIEEVEPLQEILQEYKRNYTIGFHKMMCEKLGLFVQEEVVDEFINQLEDNLEKSQIDMTIFFRELSGDAPIDVKLFWGILERSTYLTVDELKKQQSHWEMWFDNYSFLIEKENVKKAARSSKMKAINPKYVLRNYMAQLAIDAAEKGDNSMVEELYTVILQPYSEQPEMDKWYAKRPDWAMNKVGCSMLSCSS
ncbi:YdiU family protein [Vicingaceae bacterium]|nr:YdiU family protein [Vicingaceae bacterium]